MKQTIDRFINDYDFLSNFYETPVFFEGLRYRNSEAAFQAAKCLALDSDVEAYLNQHHLASEQVDETMKEKIKEVLTLQLRIPFTRMSASESKRQGRRCLLRKDWEECKEKFMLQIVRNKFTDPDLRQKLLNTGNARLIEGNTWGDTTWGMVNGKGQNLLGKILEKVRLEIEEEEFYSNLD